jgi:hypothetical protein
MVFAPDRTGASRQEVVSDATVVTAAQTVLSCVSTGIVERFNLRNWGAEPVIRLATRVCSASFAVS